MTAAYPSTPLHSQVTPKSILTEANRLVVHSGISTRSTASTMPRHDYSYGHSNPALRPVVTDSPNWFDQVNSVARGLLDRQVAARSLASPRA